jgi:predicted alpha/beta hydrolase family esterase
MWTALSLWLLHIAGFSIYGVLALHSIDAGASPWPWIAGVPILYASLIAAFTLFDFALSWIQRAPRPPAQQIGPARTLRMIVAEFRALMGSPWRMMTYRLHVRDPAPARAALPIVLVHGVLCNAGVWTSVLQKLAAANIGPVYALSYGPPLYPIAQFSAQLERLIDRVCAETGAKRVVVVGHSMGGLVVRDLLRSFGSAKVARVVTLGTPHHGSGFAWIAPGACLAQMRPGSAWLAALPPAPASPPCVSLWSPHDSMVTPQTSCLLEGATNVAFLGVGHNALLCDDDVFARVVAEIGVARQDVDSGHANISRPRAHEDPGFPLSRE